MLFIMQFWPLCDHFKGIMNDIVNDIMNDNVVQNIVNDKI